MMRKSDFDLKFWLVVVALLIVAALESGVQ